jgi:signal recognition particle subunit SRP54
VLRGVDPTQQFVHAVHRSLVELMGPEDAHLVFEKRGPTVVLMAGLQGAGKTTTCGKLARHLRDKHQKRPLLVAADIKRPAAVEQLRVLGKQLDIPVFHEPGLAAPEVCRRGVALAEAKGYDVVLLDTAGRLHIDDELMAELAEIAAVTRPRNRVLVVDAMTGQDAVATAQAFQEGVEVTGFVLTKLDGDARGGAALSIRAVTGRPIKFAATGEKLADFDAFHPDRLAGRILGMGDVLTLIERAEEQIDREQAEKMERKLREASFTLEDFLDQLQQVKKMGPLSQVLGMLPGMSQQLKGVEVDDRDVARVEAIIRSMTPVERNNPRILNGSRRARIARGSGTTTQQVNALLKQFEEARRMMKQLSGMTPKKLRRMGLR